MSTQRILALNDVLSIAGIDVRSNQVLVMRHRPTERELRDVLPWLAAEEPDVYNVYQETQNPAAEQALKKANILVSCIGQRSKQAVFVGVYDVRGSTPLTFDEYWNIPQNLRLRSAGLVGFTGKRPSVLRFDLRLTGALANWKGKLVIAWSGGERAWFQWANRQTFPIAAIAEDSYLVREMPRWDSLILSWQRLTALPRAWEYVISQWRGIYFILDRSDGKGYVGSACGAENILGRWRNYRDGHGGNKQLKLRKPENLVFSILQLTSPTMETEAVLSEEAKWKDRLHTREFGLNSN